MKLTIIIPCYNEKNTIKKLIDKIISLNLSKQIILVDDFSTDGSREIIKMFKNRIDKIIYHNKNMGKGAAIKSTFNFIMGDFVVIQDADLEYNPDDLVKMYNLMLSMKHDVLYGSRVLGKNRYKDNKGFTSIFRIFANHFLTEISNLINKQKLTDAHTCYKMFKTAIFKKINLKENDFSFCPEVTTKLSNFKIPIDEVAISYKGRSYEEGKKISFKDALKAIYVIFKYSIYK